VGHLSGDTGQQQPRRCPASPGSHRPAAQPWGQRSALGSPLSVPKPGQVTSAPLTSAAEAAAPGEPSVLLLQGNPTACLHGPSPWASPVPHQCPEPGCCWPGSPHVWGKAGVPEPGPAPSRGFTWLQAAPPWF